MTDTPSSGLEAPSRFMMGVDDDDTSLNDEAMDAAIAKAFPNVEPVDITTGNPNNVDDTDGADGGDGNEPGSDGDTSQATAEVTVPGDGTIADATQGQDQGGDENDVATGEVDFAALFTERYGRAPLPAELTGLIELSEWANNLTPAQQEAINRALTEGQAQEQVTGSQAMANPQPPVPEPTIDNPILTAAIEQYGEDDPIVQYIRQQDEQLSTLRNRYQEDFAAKQRDQAVQAINSASNTFKSRMAIDNDADLQRLQGAVTSAGIFPAFVQANGGNVELAMNAALEWAYWQDEPMRERELQKRAAATPAVQQAHKARQAKAASVTGTGGNGASRTDAPSKASKDPWAEVALGIREAQNNGVPS